jgi:hypothetical protein
MRIVLGTVLLVLAATPALAVSAPAPLLGLGIPALGAAGGALLASKFFKRK